MSTTFRVLAAIALVIVLGGIGIGVYNAGVSEGVAEAARAAEAAGEGDAVVYPPYIGDRGYGYGPGHWGFGFFGILFTIFFLFLVFGLARAAFGGGRWRGGGGGHGGWGGREERIAEMHRDLHRRDAEPHGTTS